jgi:uncharacterized repeat protein (TIGR03803 family)
MAFGTRSFAIERRGGSKLLVCRWHLFGICTLAAILAACGGSQLPIGAPSAMQQSVRTTERASPSYHVLYSFSGGSDGGDPYAALINVGGILYGTTFEGGSGCSSLGCGTVFNVTTSGKEKVLYAFGGAPTDGANPDGLLIDVQGTLYGTTQSGGAHGSGSSYSDGTFFSVTTSGKEKMLYSFCSKHNCVDGSVPAGDLININGTLYGTATAGGKSCCGGGGVVFTVTTSGEEKRLHSFCNRPRCARGSGPNALINVKGTLYGTTSGAGANGYGTVFSLATNGTEKVLYSFSGGSDGATPSAGLININGTLYGTTSRGGSHAAGTVFSVTTTGKEKTLYNFCSEYKCADGGDPVAGLINVNGTLYGTTVGGGAYKAGTVFSLTRGGVEKVLHTFGAGSDGVAPVAGLLNVNGTLYGTTSYGGSGPGGRGTVFALTP